MPPSARGIWGMVRGAGSKLAATEKGLKALSKVGGLQIHKRIFPSAHPSAKNRPQKIWHAKQDVKKAARSISSTLPKATPAQRQASTSFGQRVMGTPVKDTPGFPPTKAGRPDLAPLPTSSRTQIDKLEVERRVALAKSRASSGTSYAAEKAAKHPARVESPYTRGMRIEDERKARLSGYENTSKPDPKKVAELVRRPPGRENLIDINPHRAGGKQMSFMHERPPGGRPPIASKFASDPTGASDKLHAERKAAQVAADAANEARLKVQMQSTLGQEGVPSAKIAEAHRRSERAFNASEGARNANTKAAHKAAASSHTVAAAHYDMAGDMKAAQEHREVAAHHVRQAVGKLSPDYRGSAIAEVAATGKIAPIGKVTWPMTPVTRTGASADAAVQNVLGKLGKMKPIPGATVVQQKPPGYVSTPASSATVAKMEGELVGLKKRLASAMLPGSDDRGAIPDIKMDIETVKWKLKDEKRLAKRFKR